MMIPLHAVLVAELHCLSRDGQDVRTAQQWSDPQASVDDPRSWLRLVCNGRVLQDAEFTGLEPHVQMRAFWSSRERLFAPTRLDEDQMWTKLLELAGVTPRRCRAKRCAVVLPVAWFVCQICGRDARGRQSDARRVEPLRTGLGRNPKP